MEDVLDILKYTIPSLVLFITVYFIVRAFYKNEARRRDYEIRRKNQRITTPIRLQAYERITLFLERLSPDSMIMRVQKPGMTCKQLQGELLSTIRAEFEHNLSQQIYITPKTWEVVRSAKESTVKLINTSGDEVNPDGPAIELSKTILEKVMDAQKAPSQVAIEFIKKEMVEFF